ncbi:hypothetical protein QWZ13_15550 [Reinekea marina]|uniref:hypothetical protein n=1 Tax=Reinekea marina TaxID=1310421 RepID=UPI0025B4C50F|nr:hypothetical protein [Reinekea marina]MDN3650321.1 hypothetical protein [Reinekea marina]
MKLLLKTVPPHRKQQKRRVKRKKALPNKVFGIPESGMTILQRLVESKAFLFKVNWL